MSKFCHKCKLAIDTKNERYIKIEDIDNKKILSKILMHKDCWHELMTSKDQTNGLMKMAKNFISNANKKIGTEDTEVIQL